LQNAAQIGQFHDEGSLGFSLEIVSNEGFEFFGPVQLHELIVLRSLAGVNSPGSVFGSSDASGRKEMSAAAR
jgi:hypothetical protein